MSRAEIARRFDEIVAFAEVEKFLDTPVKRYSQRHVSCGSPSRSPRISEPEILIVDEVLAVGDAEFQKKCLGKMSEVARGGRTVLFVSHNMSAIRRLTGRCILLDRGRLTHDAPVQQAIDLYLTQAADGLGAGVFVRDVPPAPEQPFHVRRVTTRREAGGDPLARFDCDHEILVRIDYAATRKVPGLYGYMTLQRLDGTVVYEGDSTDSGLDPLDRLEAGDGTLHVAIPARVLGPGTYQIYLSFASALDAAGPAVDTPGIVGEFSLDDTGTRRGNRRNGFLSLKLPWRMAEPCR